MMRAIGALVALALVQPAMADDSAGKLALVTARSVQSSTARLSLSSQLRQATANAGLSNIQDNLPWTAPSPWVASTSYVQGAVVTNSGNQYIELNTSCTSAASGGPTGSTAATITDGTCFWTYFGQPPITSDDAGKMTLSTATGGAPIAGGVVWGPVAYPNIYRLDGATASTFATSYWQFSGWANRSGNMLAQGYQVCANVIDSQFAVGFTNGDPSVSIIIDGRVYSQSVMKSGQTGTPNWLVFTGSIFKSRQVCVREVVGAFHFAGIATSARGSVTAPGGASPLMVVLEDSYDDGTSAAPFSSYGKLDSRFADLIGLRVWHMAQGGSGLQNNASGNSRCSAFGPAYCYTFLQRAQDPANQAPLKAASVIMFPISPNDASYTSASETSAVTALLAYLSSLNPTALLLGYGTYPVNPGSPSFAQTQLLDTAGAAGFAAFSGPNPTCYVPVANDSPPWGTGSYTSAVAPSAANNAAIYIYPGDNLHPNELAHSYIARRRAAAYVSQCLPGLR